MNPGLSLTTKSAGNVHIIMVSGFLDGHTAAELERKLGDTIKAGQVRLVLDLSGLTYIASAGVGILISLQHQAQKSGGGLQIVNPTPNVREIFSILGLTSILSVHETLEAGVKAANL